MPGSPSSLAPQELAAVSDIQGRSLSHRLQPSTTSGYRPAALPHWVRGSQGHQGEQLGRGIARALGKRHQPSGVNNRRPRSGSGCLSAAFFVQKYTCNTSRRVLLAVVHCSSKATTAETLLSRRDCMLAFSLVETCRAPLGIFARTPLPWPYCPLSFCYVCLNHGQYLRPSKHNAA